MAYYITISRGPSADQATPVLALGDPEAVAAVLDAIRAVLATMTTEEPPPHDNAPMARRTIGKPR